MHLGVDADNWSQQINNPRFEDCLRRMKLDFVSWHLSPGEENNPARLNQIVQFCHRNHWSYLFNTEIANYVRGLPAFQHPDGTYRYDLAERTLQNLRDDKLFLGVVYDEVDLVQAMNGMPAPNGKTYEPILTDTRNVPASEAFLKVSEKVAELQRRYQSYGKCLIFEMTFPDYPFAFARGGALLAPKLLKENFDDLMYAVYRGAALEYHSSQLWACVDLWFLQTFPFAGRYAAGYHTPAQMLESLKYAYSAGFDFVYIEQSKALMTEGYALTEFGRKVIDFNCWRKNHVQGDWRTAPIKYYVKRFPDGYWGQAYSAFIPDHPYGSWMPNPFRAADRNWLKYLQQLSNGVIPQDADTWNATQSSEVRSKPYRAFAGLPPLVVFDHLVSPPKHSSAKVIDFTHQ